MFVLVGLYFAWKRIEVSREDQITERFTRAIEQLGNEDMAFRLGGIYALERLAKDSEKDHGTIMEVLTAYVREKAPRQDQKPVEEGENVAGYSDKKQDLELTTDIQASLTVIGRRTPEFAEKEDFQLNLSNTDLNKAILNRVDLSGAILSGANLSGGTSERRTSETRTSAGPPG